MLSTTSLSKESLIWLRTGDRESVRSWTIFSEQSSSFLMKTWWPFPFWHSLWSAPQSIHPQLQLCAPLRTCSFFPPSLSLLMYSTRIHLSVRISALDSLPDVANKGYVPKDSIFQFLPYQLRRFSPNRLQNQWTCLHISDSPQTFCTKMIQNSQCWRNFLGANSLGKVLKPTLLFQYFPLTSIHFYQVERCTSPWHHSHQFLYFFHSMRLCGHRQGWDERTWE